MSYKNTSCPCGKQKKRETMICTQCVEHILATTDGVDLKQHTDQSLPVGSRRSMAIRLLSAARRRFNSAPPGTLAPS